MAATFVDTGNALAFGASGSFTMTITAGTRAVIQLSCDVNTGSFSCNIGGTQGAPVSGSDTTTNGTNRAASFVVDNPPSGSQLVSFSTTGTPSVFFCSVTTASGSTSVGNGNQFAQDVVPANHVDFVMTSASGDLSVTHAKANGAGTPTSSQTRDWGNGTAGADHKTTSTTVNPTHTWTQNTNADWCITGVNFIGSSPGRTASPRILGQAQNRGNF